MDCSTPGFPVLHHHLEVAQTHVHWVSDVMQPSHPLSSPSPLALNLSQHQGLFQWVGSCIRWPKNWSSALASVSPSDEYSGLISFQTDWFDLFAVQGTLKNLRQHYSSERSILQHSTFFTVQHTHPHMITGKIIALTRWTFGGKVIGHNFSSKDQAFFKFHDCSHHLQWFWSPRK